MNNLRIFKHSRYTELEIHALLSKRSYKNCYIITPNLFRKIWMKRFAYMKHTSVMTPEMFCKADIQDFDNSLFLAIDIVPNQLRLLVEHAGRNKVDCSSIG